MASTNKKVTSVHIPDDLAFSILSKLPLKSLKRFTSACKSWSLLFENPHFMDLCRSDFISKHRSIYDDTCLLQHQRTRRVPFHDTLYMLSGERFEDRVKLDWPPPFQEDDSPITILGSCSVNGTFCIYHGFAYDATIVLWNPATGEFKVIPPSRQPYENCEYNLSPQGFGYDRVRDDYKVIRFVRYPSNFEGNWVYVPDKEDSLFWEMDVHQLDIHDHFWDVYIVEMYDPFWEIYSLRSNSWGKLYMPIPWPCSSAVNLNEVSHWLGIKSDMFSFDFSNEMFFTTTLPSLNMVDKHLWKRKNTLLWEGADESVSTVVFRGQEVLHAWTSARRPANRTQGKIAPAQDIKWRPPPLNYLKCNLDAAIFNQQTCVGVGMCLRDAHGNFVMARTDWCRAKMSAAEGEAWRLLETIKWLIAAGVPKVIFEMDNKQVVEDVHKEKSNKFEYGSVIDECRIYLSMYNEYQVVFTRRQANGSADTLTKTSISNATRSDFHYISGCIASIISNEMS